MATHKVNLDALLLRENFESSADAAASLGNEPTFRAQDLKKGELYFSVLRKPDFQRLTDNWTPEMIADFIQSFLDGQLVPAIIVWHSKLTNKIFIVDGAHRVSALVAWVNDDYGDGVISRALFGEIDPAQKRYASTTRKLVEERIGHYATLTHLALNSEGADAEKVRRGRAITTRYFPIQKVEGDAATAEESFLKINSKSAPIDTTEFSLIKARKKPNAIATRALISRGTGQTQWVDSPQESKRIAEAARQAYDLLFGQLHELTQTSPDIPRAGQPYSQESFQMVLDMVNTFNEITPAMWMQDEKKRRKNKTAAVPLLEDDKDGSATVQYLEEIQGVARLVADYTYAGSLGLDQAVYSYGAKGSFHTTAFVACHRFALELKQQGKLFRFTEVRKDFEEFLVRHKHFINDLGHSKGSRLKPLESFLEMYRTLMECLESGKTSDEEIVAVLRAHPKLKDLKSPPELVEPPAPARKGARPRFSKTAARIKLVEEILTNRQRCGECGSRLPPHSRSRDHDKRAQDGGTGHSSNLVFTHPYCNSGYKEKKAAMERAKVETR